jgi:fumarate hydratase subunit alpha
MKMKKILYQEIVSKVAQACIDANIYIPSDVKNAIIQASEQEENPLAQNILLSLIKNFEVAEQSGIPICQDTGTAVVFVELGQDVRIENGFLNDAINEGVRKGYAEGYLRKSIVCDPINRSNTKDNTPAIIHTELKDNSYLRITIAPKGGGSENVSTLKMLKPTASLNEIKEFILTTVKEAGGNACPPYIIGIGLGGNFEYAPYLAKKALLRNIGEHHKNQQIKALEQELFLDINKLGIGPEGFGGKATALWVNIESHPCHIASLPIAININCHVVRHKTIVF